MDMPDFEIYQSPFSWRYGSRSMRRLWSETNKRLIWRKIWVVLAEVQAGFGLVTQEQVADLTSRMNDIDLPRSIEIETEIQHDLMAELKTFAEQCPLGGGILHLGATSTDIEDNTDVIRQQAGLDLILGELKSLLLRLCQLIEAWAETPTMAYTHLQPAEPSTLGYRFAFYAQDLLADYSTIKEIRKDLKGKGFKGAVGTRASFADLVGLERLDQFESQISTKLGLKFFPITSQTYPRRQDLLVVSSLAGLGASLYKMAFDLRILQTPAIGELRESFSEKQVGSSAMPFKRNPIRSEKINSIGRYLAQFPRMAWDNAAHSLLERTLDDSANRRIMLPETFLALEELLKTSLKIFEQLVIDENAIQKDLICYGPFAATEKLMLAVVKAGADRQKMHELIRVHCLKSWETLQVGDSNPLVDLLSQDQEINQYFSRDEVLKLMDAHNHIGDAPLRARKMAATIHDFLENN